LNSKEANFCFGNLISGNNAFEYIVDCINKQRGYFLLCSAYIRSEALELLFPYPTSFASGSKLLTRWKLDDILSGASDLRSYEICRKIGLQFYVDNSYHGKVYLFENTGIIVGSANATLSGLGLINRCNAESCTLVPCSLENNSYCEDLFSNAVLIDDNIFERISEYINSLDKIVSSDSLSWPDDLLELFTPSYKNVDINSLLVSDCFHSIPNEYLFDGKVINSENLSHDLALFGSYKFHEKDAISLHELKIADLKIYKWLMDIFSNRDFVYFGELTSLLHNALIDSPQPRRLDVKSLTSNLIQWVLLLASDRFYLERPNYSEKLVIIRNTKFNK